MLVFLYFGVCASLYHFVGILKSQLKVFVIRPFLSMVFPTNFSSFWDLLSCSSGSEVYLKLISAAAARSLWNESVHHQWSRAAAFDCFKQD